MASTVRTTPVRGAAALAVIAMAWVSVPGAARAGDPPFTIGSQPAWLLLGGVTAGGTAWFHDRGGFVGGELSLVRLRDGNTFGFYGDAYRDFGMDATYVTGGLELGRRIFGVDGGAVLRFSDGGSDVGVTGRVYVSLGVLSIYVRYAYVDAARDDHVIQIGGTFKLPLHSPF